MDDNIQSWKRDFNETVDEKPNIIVQEFLQSGHYIDISPIQMEEDQKPTDCHQGGKFHDGADLLTINKVDNIKRWTVSSSVVLPVDKTENTCYVSDQSVDNGERSVDRVILADSLKNENTYSCGAQLSDLNEHTGQLAGILNVTTNPPEQSTDSDVLSLPLSSNEQHDNHIPWDSDVTRYSEPATIGDSKELAQEVYQASHRDVSDRDDIPQQIEGNSFSDNSLDNTVMLSTVCTSPGKELSEFSEVIQQSHTASGKKSHESHLRGNRFLTSGTHGRPYTCDVCHKAFTKSYHLTIHQRIHTGDKPYQCDVCNKTFRSTSNLKEQPYKCDLCDTGDKPYKCDICNKQFSRAGNLTAHQLIHTGEKLYKCDVCNKEFSLAARLTRHRRIHTGEKPFKCEICKKEFNRSDTLKIHQRSHTGQKPYKCELCGKVFTPPRTLTSHHCKPHSSEDIQV